MEGRPGPVDNTRRVLLARAGDLFASKLVCALQAKHLDAVSTDRIGDALRLIESATVSDAIVKVELKGAPCLPRIQRLREVNAQATILEVTRYEHRQRGTGDQAGRVRLLAGCV